MSGKWNQMKSQQGWQVFSKRGGGSQYDKYDSQLFVLVAKSKKPSHLYLSKFALEKIGNPTHVQILVNGSEIGFLPATAEDANAYIMSKAEVDKEDSRKFVNCRAVISEMQLRSGAYTAHLHEQPPNIMVVINANDHPSEL